jgi:phosphoglycerate kinase
MNLFTLDDLDKADLAHRRVLVRVDFNVPLEDGKVTDATRLEESLPTLRELIAAKARLLLCSHCGRPKGKRNPKYSLAPVAAELERLLGQPVKFVEDCIGELAEKAAAELRDGEVALLENLRFYAEEEANDPGFAAKLAALAEVYVDDAFGSAHRAHASVVGVAEQLDKKAAGRLLEREVAALSKLLGSPEKPYVAILGGAKIEGKIDTLLNLLPRLDILLLGGGMANTFLAAQGHDLKKSLFEPDRLDLAKEILSRAKAQGTRVILPLDLVVTDSLDAPTRIETVACDSVPDGLMAVDVGPKTREAFIAACGEARTLFWNGPLGVFEKKPFHEGTAAVAEGLSGSPGFTVIGGGETVAAVNRAGVADQLSHVSTGGGASLEMLAGKVLPGVAILAKEGKKA